MMSSIDSRPTLRRTRPGVTPARRLLLGRELAVGRAGRMDHEAADVADVGDVAVQREPLDELLAGLDAPDDLEREHRAVALAAAVASSPARATGSTASPA